MQLRQTVSETPPPEPSNPIQRNPSSVPPKPTASRSERHSCVKILGNLGTQAPLKRVLEPGSYIEPQRHFAWVCRIFSGRRRTGRWRPEPGSFSPQASRRGKCYSESGKAIFRSGKGNFHFRNSVRHEYPLISSSSAYFLSSSLSGFWQR